MDRFLEILKNPYSSPELYFYLSNLLPGLLYLYLGNPYFVQSGSIVAILPLSIIFSVPQYFFMKFQIGNALFISLPIEYSKKEENIREFLSELDINTQAISDIESELRNLGKRQLTNLDKMKYQNIQEKVRVIQERHYIESDIAKKTSADFEREKRDWFLETEQIVFINLILISLVILILYRAQLDIFGLTQIFPVGPLAGAYLNVYVPIIGFIWLKILVKVLFIIVPKLWIFLRKVIIMLKKRIAF